MVIDQVGGTECRGWPVERRDMAVFLLGRPGSGKGTQAQLLADSGWSHINVGGLVRSEVAAQTAWGLRATETMMRGGLLPTQDIQNLIKRNIAASGPSLVVEGYPRRLHEAGTLPIIFGPRTLLIPILLDASRSISISRLNGRLVCKDCGRVTKEEAAPSCPKCSGPLIIREDDRLEGAVLTRQQEFEIHTIPLIAHYYKHGALDIVDSVQNESQVHRSILKRIHSRRI